MTTKAAFIVVLVYFVQSQTDKTNVPFSQFFCMSPKNEVALSLMTILCLCLGTSFDVVINDDVR
jgi:hypothetical protein